MPLDAARLASGTLNMGRGSRALRKDFASWAGAALADIAQEPKPEDGWTPQRVGEQYLAALKWARHAAGRVGPAGFGGMRLPDTFLTDEDHAAMGWGLKECADDLDDLPTMRVQPSPAQITRHLDALEWPMRYLCPAHVGSARMMGLWASCKVFKRPFSKAIDGRGISRPAAYQLRDRGLSIISQRLAADLVPLEIG